MKKLIVKNDKGQKFIFLDYQPSAAVSYPNNITPVKEVDILTARAMHEKGQLHYVSGTGDRKVFAGRIFKRGKIGDFEIH